MTRLPRRILLGAALAAPAVWTSRRPARAANAARVLHLGHHFPESHDDHGDFRDRLVRRFAADVTARTAGQVQFEIYPEATLVRPGAQFSALRHGAVDLALCPLAFGATEVPEAAVGMVPCLVTTDAQAAAWKTAEAGQLLARVLTRHGVRILTWIWLPCAMVARGTRIAVPEDCRGLTVRSGSQPMADTLKAAGARAAPLLAEAVTKGLRKGDINGAIVSSTSLLSFRVQEAATSVTTARTATCGYSLEPLLVAEETFQQLPRDQQQALVDAGAALDGFAAQAARADADAVGEVFGEAGLAVHDLDQDQLHKWVSLAAVSGWRTFAAGGGRCPELLQKAVAVPA